MSRRKYEADEYLKIARKALRLTEQGYDRAAMAERFGVSEAEVSRMLTDARRELNRVPEVKESAER